VDVDRDEGHTRSRLFVLDNEVDVDAVVLEAVGGLAAEDIVADPGDEDDFSFVAGAEGSGRSHGLIGPLPPGGHKKLVADDGLARTGDRRHLDDHIGVDAADDGDERPRGRVIFLGHRFPHSWRHYSPGRRRMGRKF
jgi:hypothetical protein